MSARDDPLIASHYRPYSSNKNRREPKTKTKVWMVIGSAAAVMMFLMVIFDMGNKTRTTAPAVATGTAVPSDR